MKRAALMRWRACLVPLALLVLLLVGMRLLPHMPLRQWSATSAAIYARDGQLLRLSLAADEQYRVWTPLSQIDPRLVEAVLMYEDRWFYWHPGINPLALVRALGSTYGSGNRQGASTLTMQLARRLYGIRSQHLAGKLEQMMAALWLEMRYSKAELLEAYLNLAPYGGNIEGVATASLIYFHKRTDHLSLPEILSLAVIPQNPAKRGGQRRDTAYPQARLQAQRRLLQRWLQRHPELERYRSELETPPVLHSTAEMPFLAPHVTDQLLRSQRSGELWSSIDLPQQALLERIIRQFIASGRAVGVSNAAAMLVERESGRVRALVGSADYFDRAIDGQVNGTLAKRSPGSTLKPFIYALALDQGLIHPMSMLKDGPTQFGPFSPENFDGRFIGPISAQQALVRSRNIPAVALAASLKEPGLYGLLQQSGVARLASPSHYGLALALGGGELSMEELARLYLMLGNGGRLGAVRYLERDPEQAALTPPKSLLSPEAAFITLQMLQTNPRPDTGQPAVPPVAWKTGTSWGFRDAWSIGLVGRYVLLVWVGNFDGSSNPALVGVKTAAPLFFRIVDGLRLQTRQALAPIVATAPPNLTRVEVCRASGDLPNAFCHDTVSTWFIPGKSPIKVSNLHRAVRIDERTGRATCVDGPGSRVEIFEYWSDDMRKLFKEAGIARKEPPQELDCGHPANPQAEDGPQIVSPNPGAIYSLRLSRADAILLRANAVQTHQQLFWFVNEGLIGKAEVGQSLNWTPPAPGRYQIRVIDQEGRSDSREVEVEFLP
ncbi:penicillin-binding protein 1C [Herbaspirillum rubrisubalbicans Os34]|uniref:peptidoglycan glycosyltransferase n=2 Tax=Herbaspirillum rubrisubalbicans TaxID=80842 RepID=A0A6M3ZS37_9BURK|nr:penicillin-binding protein 1C [Herbaspirillum rubrisubalbicans Os34]